MVAGASGVWLGAGVTIIVVVVVWVVGPLVAVIVTLYVPGIVELQDRLAVPYPGRVPGLIGLHVRPEGTVSVRVTVSLNPLIAVTGIVDVVDVLLVTDAGLEDVTAKLGEFGFEQMFVDCTLTSVYST